MSQTDQLITDHIDIWTSAILAKSTSGRGSSKKYELYGITKLRELILELAVRGKLVPQDRNDEPASVLLEKIAAEKARLVKEGKIKKSKPLADISEDEKFFDLPQGWEWTRLGDVVEIVRGITFPASEKSKHPETGRVACLRTTNVQSNIEWEDLLYIRPSFVKRDDQYVSVNDIVMSMANSRELVGKVAIITDEPEIKTSFGGFLSVIRPYFILPKYLMALLRSPTSRESIIGSASQTTNIANISLAKLNPYTIGVPPLAEQHRIVAKVDELMRLCDDLEQQTEASIDAHATLVEVLLTTLTDSADANELAQNWARLSENFDSLFTTEQSIEALKQTVLQLAVMGKLVPQNPDDEPASVLLEKIAEDRSTLTEQGEIKKSTTLPKISEEEKPYDLPYSWDWTRLGSIAVVGTGATPLRTESKYWESKDVNWVSSGETSKPFIFDTKEKVSYLAIKETNVSIYPPGTLIVAMYGQGKTRGQITELKIEAGTNQACAAIKLIQNDEQHRYYLKLFFWKSYEEIRSNAAGGAQPNLNVSKITSTVLPLPPLAEQYRIVAKVDELMQICDQLKAKLKQSQTTQVQLTDALVEQALA